MTKFTKTFVQFVIIKSNCMKTLLVPLALCCSLNAVAQLRMPADGGSSKANVGEQIGITDVTINYGRPGVKGREGKV